jgi:hypothetical protein
MEESSTDDTGQRSIKFPVSLMELKWLYHDSPFSGGSYGPGSGAETGVAYL